MSPAAGPARVILLRHAVTVDVEVCQGARHDRPLAEDGRRQARQAVARIGAVDRCVSSPLPRARATAAASPIPAATDPNWCERDFGSWEGRPWREVIDEVPAAARDDAAAYLAFTPAGGEPWTAVTARVAAALEQLAEAGGTSLVVTHGGPIRAAVAHVLGVGLAHTLALRPDHATSTWLTRTTPPGRPASHDTVAAHGVWQLERFGW